MTRRAWLLFTAVSLLWGIPYLLIEVAVEELAPSVITVGRCGLGLLVIAPLACRRGELGSLRGRWPSLVLLGVVQIAGPQTLIAAGQERVSSSLAGLLIAAQPVFVALIALRFVRSERVRGVRLVGLALGLGGIVALLGLDTGLGRHGLLGAGMILAASFAYAVSALLVRRLFAAVPPIAAVAGTLAVATVALLGPAILQRPAAMPGGGALAAVVGLGLASTAAGLVCFYALIAEAGASRASLINYAATAIAVALGVLALSEPFGIATGVGFVLVLAGCWLASGGSQLTSERLARFNGRLPRSEKAP